MEVAETLRFQTTAALGQGLLGLSVKSPYYQRQTRDRRLTGRDTKLSLENMKAVINSYAFHSSPSIGASVNVGFYTGSTFIANDIIPILGVDFDNDSLPDAMVAAVIAWSTTNSYGTLTATDVIGMDYQPVVTTPMYVSGVAKTGYFAVVDSPTIAGGAGVARFYLDTNGDGTGTAPSEVYTPSLQAVVVNTTGAYVLTNVSVDANRKYIDITMKALTFGGVTVLGVNVLGSQSLVAAANSIAVNCFVFVKK